jgi:HMG (high mobility group) box
MPAKKDSDSSPVKKGSRKAKSTDDKPKVKRAPSAYIVFCTEKRTEAKESNPDASFGELGKILGQMWGQLDDKGKEVRVLMMNLTSRTCNLVALLSQQFLLSESTFNPTMQPYAKISAAKKAALEEA